MRIWRARFRPITLTASGLAALIAAGLLTAMPVRAETALIAVASNFAEAATATTAAFAAASGHRITVSLGSTGKIYAQIRTGAPYDAFLAADAKRPRMLEAYGLAVPGSRFTYAVGRLTLWSADPGRVKGDIETVLTADTVRALAIANPALAPYGQAARETLQKLGLWQRLKDRIVMAENIGQTFALAATGNAQLGFVATTLLESDRGKALGGSRWDVPTRLHAPIRQDAVLLERGRGNPAARDYLAFLRGAKARAIMARLGYKSAYE